MIDPNSKPAGREFVPLSICVLTVSDTRTEDIDKSGRLLADRLLAAGHTLHEKARDRRSGLGVRGSGWTRNEYPVA